MVGMPIQMYVKYNNVGAVLDVTYQIPVTQGHVRKLDCLESRVVCRRTWN